MTYDPAGNLLTVDGPLSGTADTTRTRYDAARQVVGVVSPDPDGAGAMKMRAVRNTYDSHGFLTKVEKGNVNSQSDTDWAGFTSLQEVNTTYDANGRAVTQSVASGGTTYALTQTSYDALGRVQCTAQRMNSAAFGSLPSDACTLGTAGSYGNDRIVKTSYDYVSRPTLVQSAYGVTGTQADEVSTVYTDNSKTASVTDAEGNKTSYVYDGFDRLYQTQYPSTTKGAGTSNSSDYEQFGYDANGNVTSRRTRANETISYSYDALDRLTAKTLPNSEPSVGYAYDVIGRMISAATSVQTLSFTYDALGRNLTQVGPQGTVTSAYDIAGRRTRITHPDGFYVDQDYLVTGELTQIRENGATSGVGVLATYAYDDLGRRTSLTRGDGSSTSYTYDSVSRLTQLAEDLAGTSYDQTLGFSYNPASQITQNTRSNDAYAWTGHYNVNRGYTANGLNQYTASGTVTPTYDSRGNLTSAGTATYTYSSENLLTAASGGITLSYDPAMRLYQTAGGTPGTTRFAYDGAGLIAEYNGSNTLQRRYVHGPGTDEPIVWYEGSGTSDRRFLHADERGSVVAIGSNSGTSTNSYDEYGIPRPSNAGRFQYTGQTWLPELGMYYYKARIYSPTLGRFLQTDPIGYGAGMNRYGYVGADPVNASDPSGLAPKEPPVVCTGTRIPTGCGAGGIASSMSGESTGGPGGQVGGPGAEQGRQALEALTDTGNLTDAQVMQLGQSFVQFGEFLQGSDIPRNAVVQWGFGENGFSASVSLSAGTVQVPDFLYEAYQHGFLSATFVGSAAKTDADHAIARNPILLQNAVNHGTMFYLSSATYWLPVILLQGEAGWGTRTGIVEYIMPQDAHFFVGTPQITHARFIAGGNISGFPNNDRGLHPDIRFICYCGI